jgi:hypothetical protein
MEITISDNHDIYELTHYFKNGNIAWKAMHNLVFHNKYKTGYDRKASRENVIEIFNENGDIITLDEFDELYDKKYFKTDNIYDLFLRGISSYDVDCSLWVTLFDPFIYVTY